jgi:hypothetical protein
MNTLTLPQQWGAVSLVPRASYRATYYSETKLDEPELRQIPGVGMQVSMQATKVLSDKTRWYGKGLRHKIEPYADYIYENSSVSPDDVYVFDDIDLLHDENKVQLGLRNILQTKRDNRVSQFIDLDLYTYYLIDDYGTGNDFDSLFVNARMPLTKRTMVDMYGEIDWNNGEVPFFDTRLSHDRGEVIFSIEHLYRPGSDQSLWTPRVDLYPDEKVSFEAYLRYNDKKNDVQEVSSVVYMNWCCMRYGLGAHFYDENEIRIMFSIGLSAFPEARMGTSF